MTEVTASKAAEILATNRRAVQRRVAEGLLPARRQGPKGIAYIEVDDLRKFAKKYGYRFDEAKAAQYAK